MLLYNTPIEEYEVSGIPVYVKREDLCSPPPLPPLEKLRGIELILKRLKAEGITTVGVIDTRVSKAGWGVAGMCKEYGMNCIVVYPKLKGETNLPFNQEAAKELGAEIYPIRGNYTRINYAVGKKYVESRGGVMLPWGLVCDETVKAVSLEAKNIDKKYYLGSLVLSVGSGTIISGILSGLDNEIPLVFGISSGVSARNQLIVIRKYLHGHKDYDKIMRRLTLIEPIMPYEKCPDIIAPFPTHPNYDLKAWHWLTLHVNQLKRPILFWNIGA